MKYAWIDAKMKAYPLLAMGETLTVSMSGYGAWKRGGSPNRKRLSAAQMLTLIHSIHQQLKGAYGSPRMLRELRARGFPAGERLMRENNRECKLATLTENIRPRYEDKTRQKQKRFKGSDLMCVFMRHTRTLPE